MSLKDKLSSLSKTDRIFIDWYDLEIGSLMKNLRREIQISVFLMGGDFYEEPMLWHYDKILEEISTRYYIKRELLPHKWARRPMKLLGQLRIVNQKIINARSLFLEKKSTVQRINNILINRYDYAEVELIRKIYDAPLIKHLSFSFDQNFEAAKAAAFESRAQQFYVIQVGNSATIANNHLDIFGKLKRFRNEKMRLFLPIAYGNALYGQTILDAAENLFPNKVDAQTKFVDRNGYIDTLNQTDVCLMGHIRSQALGNCITLLTLGKKIFFNKRNPLYNMFQSMGVVVFTIESIQKMSFSQFITPLSKNEIEENRRQLELVFSDAVRLRDLELMLNGRECQ